MKIGRGAAAAVLLCSSAAFAADSVDDLAAALAHSAPDLDIRLRYENVGQNNALKDAEAYTARLRLGYTMAKWNAIDAMLQFEDVTYLGDEAYNSTRNGKTGFSTVSDPKGDTLSQGWIRFTGVPDTTIKVGRNRLIYDNARFIGDSGWRQKEQTFDGAYLTNTSLPNTTLNYAYLANVSNVAFLDFRLRAHLVNAAYAAAPWLNLVAYDYLLDFDQDVGSRQDTQTPGVRLTGAIAAGPGTINYTAEYARQLRYKDAPDTTRANYYLAELGYGVPLVNGKLGYEVLGSNGGQYGFQTPLATLHAFQGWADQFLTTPNTGIRDAYAAIGGSAAKIAWLAMYHRYKADEGGAHYGNELNLQTTYPITTALNVGAKYADYVADTFSVRTRKTWAWVEYRI